MTDLTKPHIAAHVHKQLCNHCGSEHTYSHLYISTTSGKTRKLLPVKRATDVSGLELVPIAMPKEVVPFCHSCMVEAIIPDYEAQLRWAEAVKRKAEEAKPAPNSTPKTASFDDLD